METCHVPFLRFGMDPLSGLGRESLYFGLLRKATLQLCDSVRCELIAPALTLWQSFWSCASPPRYYVITGQGWWLLSPVRRGHSTFHHVFDSGGVWWATKARAFVSYFLLCYCTQIEYYINIRVRLRRRWSDCGCLTIKILEIELIYYVKIVISKYK